MDLAAITSVVSSIKSAIEIANLLKKVEGEFQKAESKLALADMINALADAKIAMANLQDEMQQKDQEIARLVEDLRLKSSVMRVGDAYYDKDKHGTHHGDPYCQTCFESTGRLHHLVESSVQANAGRFICKVCKNSFLHLPTRRY